MKPSERQAVIRCPAISVGGRLLWCIIETYADASGEGAFPSVARIMRDAGCQKGWVKKHLKELEKWGLIERGKRQVGNGWPVNEYRLYGGRKVTLIMGVEKEPTYEGRKVTLHQSPPTIPKARNGSNGNGAEHDEQSPFANEG